MPPHITNNASGLAQAVEYMRIGTPVALSIMAGFVAIPVGWAHFNKVRERGHFDKICDECATQAGMSADDIAHVEEWSVEDRERIRKAMVRAHDGGFKFLLKWRPGRKRGLVVDHARPGGTGIEITATQPIG